MRDPAKPADRELPAGSDPGAWLAAVQQRAATWEDVARAARGCRACPLWKRARVTVFGEGAPQARVVLVGEQPGDREDRAGQPFVGPAGRLLDRCLEEAGLPRSRVYLTNAVKHFKWKPSGKRRLHERPSVDEARACQPWLHAELGLLRPDVVVCLGATAARSVVGRPVQVTKLRGQPIASPLAPRVFATLHPSALLRIREDAARREAVARFVADLRTAARALPRGPRRAAAPRRRPSAPAAP